MDDARTLVLIFFSNSSTSQHSLTLAEVGVVVLVMGRAHANDHLGSSLSVKAAKTLAVSQPSSDSTGRRRAGKTRLCSTPCAAGNCQRYSSSSRQNHSTRPSAAHQTMYSRAPLRQ